jgi:hypothetical protein
MPFLLRTRKNDNKREDSKKAGFYRMCQILVFLALNIQKSHCFAYFCGRLNNIIHNTMAGKRTFTIIKPDAVGAGNTGAITKMIEEAGFRIVAIK